MDLTKEDEKMLSGEYGGLVQEAMSFLVKLGEGYQAKRMIDISYSYAYIRSGDWGRGSLNIDLLQEAAESGVKVRVPTTNWNYGMEVNPRAQNEVNIAENDLKKVRQEAELCKKFGMIPVNTCAPYLIDTMDRNFLGAHISAVESSAITYYNTVWGSRTSRDGLSAFFSAITGRYPEFGYHLDENRVGKYLFDVQAELKNPTEYSLLGYYIGEIVEGEVPVITGIKTPRVEELKALCCAMSTGGSVTLAHIVGVTPEARTLNMAFGGLGSEEKISVTTKELKSIHQKLSDEEGHVDFILMGCPHYSIHEIKRISELLDGKRIKKDVKVWIMTAPATYWLAKLGGYADIIEKSGALILATCPFVSPGIPGPVYTQSHPEYSVGNVATDSTKIARYANLNLNSRNVYLGNTEKCIKAAISGSWGG